MISFPSEAIDDMCEMLKEAWDANALTTNIPIVWLNVAASRMGEPDPFGDAKPWLEFRVLHETSSKRSLRGRKGSRYEEQGSIVAQVSIARGKGTALGVDIMTIVRGAFRGKRSPGGVTFKNVQIADTGPEGSWYVVSVTGTFMYDQYS